MSWTCPFCGQPQPITSPHSHTVREKLKIASKYGDIGLTAEAISCANTSCREVSLRVWYGKGQYKSKYNGPTYFYLDEGSEHYRLRPSSFAKPQPASVPPVLANDYYEACKIRDLSPKASATLSRRVLQGMIRDFCGISKPRLIDEIKALKKLDDEGKAPKGVESETIAAIDHVREIGNIGAHMESDINVIVDVDPGEAQALIELIEMLFDEWYVARSKREAKLDKIRLIAEQKHEIKDQAKKAAKSEQT